MATQIPLYQYQMHTRKNENKTLLDSDQENEEANKTDLDRNDKNM